MDTVFSQGDNTTLVCTAMGGPENTFQWDMNGRIVANESMVEVNDIDASSGGIYTCTVSNAAGNDSASTTLYVAPYIVTPLDEQTLTADGLNVMINCDAAGSPSPTVNWMDMTDSEVSNTSLLQFDPVMFEDEGIYRCVASTQINGTDFTTSDDTTLIGNLVLCLVYPYIAKYSCYCLTSQYSFPRRQRCCISSGHCVQSR